ncbi:MAG: cytochrome c-type biogenesis protein, partial [Pseudomonadota bacterium]
MIEVLAKAFVIAALLGVSAMAVAIDSERAFEDDAMQARYQRLIAEVRCLTCQNQSIKDSNAPLARDLRAVVREQMEAGASDAEIYAFLQARYGDFALYKPPFSARTALLWLSPVVLVALGGFAIVRVVRRRANMD